MGDELLIRGGALADWRGIRRADLYIRDGRIADVGRPGADCPVLDAAGLTALPAFIDLHAHFRDPGYTHKEDVRTGCAAAVAGGYTTVNLRANTAPVTSTLTQARDIVRRAAETGLCDVYQSVSLTRDFGGDDLSLLDSLADDPGCEIVKFISEDGHGVARGDVLYHGLKKCRALGRTLLIHAEDADFSGIDMGFAEDLETLRDCYIAECLGIPVHFCHVSTQRSARAILAARERGAKITFEVTPHHLALTEETDYRVNPPLRGEADRAFLIECVKNGFADAVATDHAPHSAADKAAGAPGLIGLETAFPACYTELVRNRGIPLPRLSHMMSKFPAELTRIPKGDFTAGNAADLVLVDLNQEITVDAAAMRSKSANTPFDGMRCFGKIVRTIKAGRTVYEV